MDGNKRDFFRKRPSNQFKRKGVSKKPKRDNWSHEQSSGNSHSDDTVYRILCPSRKIGGVIGKGGGIVKALREETRAKITVAESVPGSEERVIIIYSSPLAISKNQETEDPAVEDENKQMLPQCAAQDALLKVHDRIIEEDLFGGMAPDDDNGNTVVTIRLLVPNNMVGCLLGKGGDVIKRLRTETSAGIRVLPAEHLPPCAMRSDELVQISGQPNVAKRALYKVSTLLHQNPRKDKPPSSFITPSHGRSSYPAPGVPRPNMPPPENSAWPHRNPTSRGMPPPAPWMEGHGNHASRFGPGAFDRAPPERGGDVSAEFSMKILCSAGKIGGVIGKGGFNVKQLQQETGASIHVEYASTDSDERVIRISAFEASWNQRSQTIDTILELQNKTSELSEKGTITTRLLVPSSKVGCLLGKGGHVINEMRTRTQADIRVISKDDKPKCAAEDEELVQISGNFGVAKDALAEISMRLRGRTMRDSNGAAPRSSSGPPQGFGPSGSLPTGGPQFSSGPPQGFGPSGSFPTGGLPPTGAPGSGRSGAYEPLRGGGHEYGPRTYHVPPAAGIQNVNSALEPKIPYNTIGSHVGTGSHISQLSEGPGSRVKLPDIQSGSERVIDIHGSAERLTAPQNVLQLYITHGGPNVNPQPGSYQQTYQQTNAQPGPHHNINAQQNPYQSINAQQQSPYPMTAQQNLYPVVSQQEVSYPPQSAYHNFNAQQGAYQPRL